MTYCDDVRRHYLHDPLCSDEHYGHLMEQADEADRAAEYEAERLSSLDTEDNQVYPGDDHPGDYPEPCPFCLGYFVHTRYCPDLEG